MKTRIMIKNLRLGLVTLFLMMLSATSYSQACPGNNVTVTFGNFTYPTASSFEFDVLIYNTGSTTIKLASLGGALIYNAGMTTTGTFTKVSDPAANDFPTLNIIASTAHTTASRQLRWSNNPATEANSVTLPPYTGEPSQIKKFARFRYTTTNPSTFPVNYAATLTPTTFQVAGVSHIAPLVYCNGNTNSTNLQNGFSPTLNGFVTIPSPYNVNLNPPACPSAAVASNLVAESPCAGAANGSATVTLTSPPSPTATVSYYVDSASESPTSVALVGGAFTVNGLSAGSHTVTVTYPSCSAITTSSFTIDAGAPVTNNGSVSTSICEGATYTWPANGVEYTTAQTNLQYVDGCNTATLNLTITPATTTGSATESICEGQTYTWPANGVEYTTAQTNLQYVDGCNTATLNLTVNPLTTTGSESVTACGSSYTWSVSGQSYNASGVYPYTVGCNTATLTLTLNTEADVYYADTDGDTYGAGAPIESCTGQPANTSTNDTDCAPEDPTRWRTGMFYVDADGDGYNNGFPPAEVCYGATVPAGFTTVFVGSDCDDTRATSNANAVEIPGNGFDDNCNGSVDEIKPTSNLNSTSCGITLTYLSNSLFAYPMSSFPELGPIQGYRFEVTSQSVTRTYDATTNSFSLLNLAGGASYATTYVVRVSIKTANHWGAYGAPCNVTTPLVPNATSVSNPTCGSTLSDFSQSIFATSVPSATGYRFRVRNGAALVGTYDSSVNRFSLTNIPGATFGVTYTIDVLLRFGTEWRPDSEYGPTCTISSPATPGLSRVVSPSCGSTTNNLWVSIFAQQVNGAQGYKFVVTNGAQTREYPTSNSRFSLQNLPGGAVANTAYTIRVDVLFGGSYVVGTQLCTITTSPTATRQSNIALDIYEVKAYPNPFADNFKLDLNSSSEDQVGVRVYDMLGREVESRQASVSTITNLEIGALYPSGVYNIVVTQGDHVKTLRVIKR